jgi:hypothetical protein
MLLYVCISTEANDVVSQARLIVLVQAVTCHWQRSSCQSPITVAAIATSQSQTQCQCLIMQG